MAVYAVPRHLVSVDFQCLRRPQRGKAWYLRRRAIWRGPTALLHLRGSDASHTHTEMASRHPPLPTLLTLLLPSFTGTFQCAFRTHGCVVFQPWRVPYVPLLFLGLSGHGVAWLCSGAAGFVSQTFVKCHSLDTSSSLLPLQSFMSYLELSLTFH